MMKSILRKALYLLFSIGFVSAHADAFTDFFRAVDVDDARTVTGLLQRGFDANAANEQGFPALVLAMRGESFKAAEALLLQPGLRVDATTAADETALMMAALKGRVDWAQRLIERGGQVNRAGWTPLHYAASGPEPAVVALLVDRGASLDARSPNGTTPLMMAARYGKERSADLLLARGADAGAQNDRQLTAAGFARAAGREALAERLERAARR